VQIVEIVLNIPDEKCRVAKRRYDGRVVPRRGTNQRGVKVRAFR